MKPERGFPVNEEGFLKTHDGADRGIQEADAMFGGNMLRHAVRFVPRVHGKGVLVMMDGEDLPRLQIKDGFFEVFGHGVDISPVGVILSVFQESEVDSAKPFLYLLKTLVIASVAADIDLSASCFYQERSPERLVALT